MSYQRNVKNKLGLPIARHCGPDRRNVFLRLMPTPGYGFIWYRCLEIPCRWWIRFQPSPTLYFALLIVSLGLLRIIYN